MALSQPLLDPAVRAAVRRAAEAHRGTPWTCTGFTDLGDLAAHPCGIFHGQPFPVFAKLSTASDAAAQFAAELAGLRLLRDLAGVAVPVPVADGVSPCRRAPTCCCPRRCPSGRPAPAPGDWRSIGRALATCTACPAPGSG